MEQTNLTPYQQMRAEELAKAEAKAREYFYNKKEHKTYYVFSGCSSIDGDDTERSYYFDYTPEQFQHLIQLMIDTYNKDAEPEAQVTTLKEISDDINLWELEGYNAELDKMYARCNDGDMLLTEIDSQPHHLYAMSMFVWQPGLKEMSKRLQFKVGLTDEEYITLLTEQIANQRLFTFNRMIELHPEIAAKINEEADGVIGDGTTNNGMPFLIILDELQADAEAVNGPLEEYAELYFESDEDSWYHVVVGNKGRKMHLFDEEKQAGSDNIISHWLKEIDADAVMKQLEVVDYLDMFKKFKEQYNTKTAFQDIKAWFDAKNFTYEES